MKNRRRNPKYGPDHEATSNVEPASALVAGEVFLAGLIPQVCGHADFLTELFVALSARKWLVACKGGMMALQLVGRMSFILQTSY